MEKNTIENGNCEEEEVREKRSICKSIRNYFREYCVCTSIHGFRYFGEKRTIFERVWWFIVFTITLFGCVLLIRQVYRKWERSPVIVSFATRGTAIYSIPFPAVTICPESKFIQSLYNNTEIIEKLLNNESLNETESKRFDYMSLICNHNPAVNYSDDQTFRDDFFNELEEISALKLMNFSNCEYMGSSQNCLSMFKPIITDEGVCLTFNMLDRTEIYSDDVIHFSKYHEMGRKSNGNWSMDSGYSDLVGINPYPRRALLAGAANALTITITALKENLDYTCRDSLQGFRVILHAPMRIPLPSQDYFRVPFNQVVVAAVQPVMITTSESVKMYNPIRRECFFPNEHKLKFFKIYTQLNCKLECLTNYTYDYCGCVNFFMPRDVTMPLCGIGSYECMKQAERRLHIGVLYKTLTTPRMKRKWKKKQCDCLPICTDLSYDAETSQTDWDWKKNLQIPGSTLPPSDKEVHRSKLIIYFKSRQFITSQRHELYGPTDFLANFGGLLGLFTGFSVLSLMEIIYFLTVRMFCNLRLYGYCTGPEI